MLKPYMPQYEIAMLDAVFALKRPAWVLEFGAGGSTVRWSGLPFIDHWIAIEHEEPWRAKVSKLAYRASVLKVSSSPAGYFDAIAHGLYDYGDNSSAKADLIFVDGLHRVDCIKNAALWGWLAPGGVVILHDASRIEYAPAWDVFPHRVTLTKGNGLQNGLMLMWGDE